MNERSRGVVIHALRYGDTSLIVKVFTENFGLQTFLIKGAYGRSSKLKSAFFQPLTLIEFVCRLKATKDLQFMSEVSIETPFINIPFNPSKGAIVLFISELLGKTVIETNANKPLFNFIHDAIHWLDLSSENFTDFHLYFCIELSRHLGFSPKSDVYRDGYVFDLMQGAFKPYAPSMAHFIPVETSSIFKSLCDAGFENIGKIQLSNVQRRELLYQIIMYYRLHVAGFNDLHSHHVLRTVMG